MTPDDPRHGTTRGYHAGCRDLCCRRAIARYEKQGRLARLNGGRAVPALGAQRRLQALMALGWSSNAIAVQAGLAHRNHVWRIINGQNGKPTTWIQRSTDTWVREVYERLCMTVPTGRFSNRTRQFAAGRGWPPPLAWLDIDDPDEIPDPGRDVLDHDQVDHAVVARVLGGDWRLHTTRAEKEAVVGHWIAQGRPLVQLEALTGWKPERYYAVTREETA